jgi:hypothetical protein
MISNFINLSSYCVLEFRATPIGDANPPLLTSQFYLVDNKHLGIKQIYNTDGYSATTRNTRNFSLIGLGGSKLIYNDITLIPMYSDFDPLITETTVSSELSINMVMDTMRFHFASGFNFTDVEHIIVGARHKLNNITQIQLANIILNAVTTAALFSYNTRPLFLANTIYDKYIDIKIPSIPWLDADFKQFGASSFEHAITGGIGFIKNAPITVFLAEATQSDYFAPNNITYEQYQITQYYEGSVSQINKFDTLGCQIAEAEDGDYIEFFATWNGAFPDSLIATLNESGADQEWIISHQLTIYEHIGSDIVLSGNSLIYQESNFDTPLTYRPILKQAGFAVAMSIDYIMRLINKKNGDQVIKSASMSIINPNRYGKKLEKIELLNGPQSMRIYNKIEQKNFETNAIFSGSVPSISTSAPSTTLLTNQITLLTSQRDTLQALYTSAQIPITSVIKQISIQLSSGNALSPIGEQLIYGQGRAVLVIDPVDNLIKLTLYKKETLGTSILSLAPINLVAGFNSVTFKLTFGTTNDFIFSNTSIGNISSLANGELLFRIPKVQAKLLLENSENTFMVTKVDPLGTETLMYTGTWLSSSDYQAANTAVDIARENAVTAAALATALATINTLNLEKSLLTTQKNAAIAQKNTAIAEKNTAVTAFATHMAIPHNTGTGGGPPPPTTTTTTAPAIVEAISGFGPQTGNVGSTVALSGNFNFGNPGTIKVGSTPAVISLLRPNDNAINFTIPAGVNIGTGNLSGTPNLIYYTGSNGSVSTSAGPFTVTEPANTTTTVHYHVYVGNRTGSAGAYTYADWPMDSPTTMFYYNMFEIQTEIMVNGVGQGFSNPSTQKVFMRSPASTYSGLTQLQITGPNPAAAVYVNGLSYDSGWVSGTFTMLKTDRFKIIRSSSTSNNATSISDSVWLTDDQIYRRNYTSGQFGYSAPYNIGLGNGLPYSAQVSNGYIYFTEEQLSGKTIHIWSGAKSAY